MQFFVLSHTFICTRYFYHKVTMLDLLNQAGFCPGKLNQPEFCPGKLKPAEIFSGNLKSQLSSF